MNLFELCMVVGALLSVVTTTPKKNEYDPMKKLGMFCFYTMALYVSVKTIKLLVL